MKTTDGELISMLLDGETPAESRTRSVSLVLDGDPQARETFARYRLIGDLMRDESMRIVPVADRVRRALRDEPTIMAPRRREGPQWLRPAAGLAVAASVAAVAVVVAPQFINPQQEPVRAVEISAPPSQLAASSSQVAMTPRARDVQLVAAAAPADVQDADGPRWKALNADLEDRLNRLVIEHQEFGGRTGVNGPVPHIGFVSYDAR